MWPLSSKGGTALVTVPLKKGLNFLRLSLWKAEAISYFCATLFLFCIVFDLVRGVIIGGGGYKQRGEIIFKLLGEGKKNGIKKE